MKKMNLFLGFLVFTGIANAANVSVHTKDSVENAADVVVSEFDVVKGKNFGKPIIQITAKVRSNFGGKASLILDRSLSTRDNTYYIVRPRLVQQADELPVAGGQAEVSEASITLTDADGLEFNRAYTFIVLNHVQGSARHATVMTMTVPMFNK